MAAPDPAAAQTAPVSPSDIGTSSAQAASQDADVSGAKTVQSIIPKSQLGERFEQKDYHFVNVMELLLLRQDLNSYLEQYNVCTCDRCMADVCALVLTGLPAKYVVTNKDSVSPILGYYESKFKIYMLTELIKACNKVRESPRH
ncbi:MAG: late competence development ComFB family protein [Lachnospiraceae bacterium]|nr:late competence development ComFB family protein [Lachnospiraceae bacterium]